MPDDVLLYCNQQVPILEPNVAPLDAVLIQGEGDIQVSSTVIGKQRIYTISSVAYFSPVFQGTANPIAEVGDSVDQTFNLEIIEGRDPLVSRAIVPDDLMLDLDNPFVIPLTNITRNTVGLEAPYVITVIDENAIITQRSVGVQFYFRMFQGYSENAVLTESEIEALVNNTLSPDIITAYGGENDYTIPVGNNKYVYWAYPTGGTGILGATEGPLPVPLYFGHSNVSVTNSFGVVQNYRVIRTENALEPQTFTLNVFS